MYFSDSDEEPKACDDFKIDVAATEFNTCINCHLHRKFHKETQSTRPSITKKSKEKKFFFIFKPISHIVNKKCLAVEPPKPFNLEKNAILKKTDELDRKEEERREKEKKEQEKKKEVEAKKPIKEENNEKEGQKNLKFLHISKKKYNIYFFINKSIKY